VPKTIARALLAAAVLVAVVGCGYDTSATFNADGSVTVGLKFLFPKSLMQGSGGTTVSGLSPSQVAAANAQMQKQYPGSKIATVTEGDESGALITIPFKTEKDAFSFLTLPSKLKPAGATSGTGLGLNLSNTGGLFTAAAHTTSGSSDTYTFTTAAQSMSTPSPGQQQIISDDEVASIFVVTFSLTVPHVITSAPGALFTLDRKTAIWKLTWTKSQTLTATTGASDAGLVANVSPLQDARLVIAVGFIAIAVGFLAGMLMAWRGLHRPVTQAVAQHDAPIAPQPAPPAPQVDAAPVAWPGPPPEAPPPTKLT
jgi:hypothetical protein